MKREKKRKNLQNKVTRRDALGKITRITAIAAGIGTEGLHKLLAQKPRRRVVKNRNQIVMKKSINEDIKQLKVMLENNMKIFTNEYGRVTPVRQISPGVDIPIGLEGLTGSFCLTHFGGPSIGHGTMDWCTGTNICNGQGLGPSDPGDAPPCDGTNVCNGQDCQGLKHCPSNTCRKQNCPNLDTCDKNKQAIVSCVNDLIETHRNDPYIQVLFEEYGLTNTMDLIRQLEIRVDNIAKGIYR